MILRRLGNKRKLLPKLLPMFPKHDTYFEPFFGTGSVFFGKERAKYNYLNDSDGEVTNVFHVWKTRKDELYEAVKNTPYSKDLLAFWRKNREDNELWQAVRFLFASNYTFLGKGETLKFGHDNNKKILIQNIDDYFEFIQDVQINNVCFRDFFQQFALKDYERNIKRCFAYLDPPYLGTSDNYEHSFKESDSIDLFDAVTTWGGNFAMSEFDNPFILQQAKERGLNVYSLGERRSLNNRNTEILVTNYIPDIMQNKKLMLF